MKTAVYNPPMGVEICYDQQNKVFKVSHDEGKVREIDAEYLDDENFSRPKQLEYAIFLGLELNISWILMAAQEQLNEAVQYPSHNSWTLVDVLAFLQEQGIQLNPGPNGKDAAKAVLRVVRDREITLSF
jgi:hypothetical protein